MWAHVFVRGYHRSVTFARTTIRGRLENKTLDDEPSSEGVDQIRACDQLRHAISLYRPCVSPLPSWRRNKKGEEEREKSVAKRHRRSPLYAPLRVYLARVCAREISCWSRSGCFHGERRVLRGSRKRQAKRNWTRRVTRAAILEKFRSRHSRSFLLLWEERTEREWKEREREKGRERGKKGNGGSWATVENYLRPFILLPSDLACPQPTCTSFSSFCFYFSSSPSPLPSLPFFLPFFFSLLCSFLLASPTSYPLQTPRFRSGFLQACGNRERDFCPDQPPIARARPLGLVGIFPRFSYYELRDNEGCGISSGLMDVENCARIA